MKLLPLILSIFVITVSSSEGFEIIKNGLSGKGVTTRYWDCCKPSCSWQGNLRDNTSTPVTSCAADGVTAIDIDAQSGCGDDGVAYMCTNQSPWIVNPKLAYGFAAASFTGGADVSQCCSCFLLTFTEEIVGKQMLVQVTNTGGDLNTNQFDLAMPGGGVGLFTQGCVTQWNAPSTGWGERYGGVSKESDCSQLPSSLQEGCKFRFEFMEGVSNPPVTFQEVVCPDELVKLTGCKDPI